MLPRCVRRTLKLGLAVCLFAPLAGLAQELSALAGGLGTGGFQNGTTAWQIQYREELNKWVAVSEAYINEGHLPGHSRDGTASEVWLNLPLPYDNMEFSVGAGFRDYFDNETLLSKNVNDVHGTGPIFSAELIGDLYRRTYWTIMFQRITPRADFQSNTLMAGIGIWIGKGYTRQPKEDPNWVTPTQEITVFGGKSVLNTGGEAAQNAFGAEWRTGVLPALDWTVTYINEGNPDVIKRNGFGTQLWPMDRFFHGRLVFGMGIGVYMFIDRKNAASQPFSGLAHSAGLAGLVTPTIAYRFNDKWLVRLNLNRVVSDNQGDADVLQLGVGYRFGTHFDVRRLWPF